MATDPPVYYGDLKPDNLMLGENGRLYLIVLGGAVNGYRYEQRMCMAQPVLLHRNSMKVR